MKKQTSTTSTTAMLEEALAREQNAATGAEEDGALSNATATATITITGLPVTASHTVVPIREEFRCRRFWFFYHDLKALTTSVSLLKGIHSVGCPAIIAACVLWETRLKLY